MTLTRDAILSATDMTLETVDVPEWGGTVCVKPMTGVQRDQWEALVIKHTIGGEIRNTKGLRGFVLVRSLCDDTGALLFTEDDIAALDAKNANVRERLFEIAQRVSGLRDVDIKRAEGN